MSRLLKASYINVTAQLKTQIFHYIIGNKETVIKKIYVFRSFDSIFLHASKNIYKCCFPKLKDLKIHF